jgi:hypothetical protein
MWVFGGRSAIGTAHEKAALPCQDFWASRLSKAVPNRHVIALADGAGFAKHAESAACSSVNQALEGMAEYTGDLRDIGMNEVCDWLSKVRERLSAEAKEAQCDLTDFSCTLLGALVEGEEAYFWQIGDGGWVVQTERGIEVATWPSSGEFINQTVFATSATALTEWTHAFITHTQTILGFTDGLEHLCLDFPNKAVHEPLVTKLFSSLSTEPSPVEVEDHLESFLSSRLVNDRTDDDKTMVLAWQRSAAKDANG